ncbi:Universal stress protein family [Vibrio sp. B1FLJ16]|uniref:universal stress protein n=1 Tax=Vibrio sp. B1FLJ16 TaxID=2751178 RepID=UPI0015F68524|nr:universal stress protein [Vibrio sp. B1FLJ16]CAD7820574.1 Universal stress protein family [Vibrio sp. B1FLJ16]CAE6943492.1 Universal stress protein family [Vibrio sp. B1FLJ16]
MNYAHILVAVDLSESSKIVIDKAIKQARDSNSKLSFVYVDVDRVVLEPKKELDLLQELQELADQCGYPVNEIMVVNGDLHVKLKGLVKQSNIDLVVCGHHHNLLSRLFSSVPKVANSVEADMLVVYLQDE